MKNNYLRSSFAITLWALLFAFSPMAMAMMGGGSGGGGHMGGGYGGSNMGGGSQGGQMGNGWNAGPGRQSVGPNMDMRQAEGHASQYLDRNYAGGAYHMSEMSDHGSYYATEIRDKQGRVVERLLIDKQTGNTHAIRP